MPLTVHLEVARLTLPETHAEVLYRAVLRNVNALGKKTGNLEKAIPAFGRIFEALGRTTSYESALNVYVCSLSIAIGADSRGINPAGNNGPWRAVCR